ncbi:MAG: sulfatase-like hydrolase/transferase [Cyclobacteriaceae bacterium]|nr:sulfatase-like hydrolase/transferase [Cyclobacteriaceae bacterium]
MKQWINKRLSEFHWKSNLYVALAASLALLMVLFMVCRIAFFLFNADFFPGMTLERFSLIAWGGLRFDLTAVLYLNLLFILLMIIPFRFRFRDGYQRFLKGLFLFTNTLGLIANVADTVYYRYTLRRTTLSVIRQFENEKNIPGLFGQFLMDYWYALLFIALLFWVMYRSISRIRITGPQVADARAFYGGGTLLMVVIVGLVVAGIRGGFGESTRPITLSNAAQYATVPKDINLVLNTPFALLRTAKTPIVQKVNYFSSDAEAETVFSPVRYPKDTLAFTPRNVVIIILESFSKEFFGAYNQSAEGGAYRGYTPFLDSLIGRSHAFQYSFANGRKSIDAMPSVICSIPAIEVPFVLSHYSGNRVTSLAALLKEKGYYTAFFHGAPNGSMGFQAFANTCGFDDYFGKDEYGNDADYDGIWGIWDHKFLEYYADKMATFKEPFYTNFFSVSSHHPYNLPEEFTDTFKGGEMTIYKCIEYTDYALRKFFEKARRMPWYPNTLFVITADHASAQIRLKEYNTAWGYFSVPIFFFEPGNPPMAMEPEIIQQIDIMPSVLSHLHYDKPYVAFGRDILDRGQRPVAFNFLDDTYQSFAGSYLLQFDGEKSVGLYDFKKDRLLANNLLLQLPDTVRKMETELKAFVQQYKNRMVDDNLTLAGSQLPGRERP